MKLTKLEGLFPNNFFITSTLWFTIVWFEYLPFSISAKAIDKTDRISIDGHDLHSLFVLVTENPHFLSPIKNKYFWCDDKLIKQEFFFFHYKTYLFCSLFYINPKRIFHNSSFFNPLSFATLSSIVGWVENNFCKPLPVKGDIIIICAVSGLFWAFSK